jgi:hypothetical protein
MLYFLKIYGDGKGNVGDDFGKYPRGQKAALPWAVIP